MNDNINKTVNEILESYSKHEQTCRLSEDNIINKSVLIQVLEEIRKLLFPGYFDKNRVREEYIGYIVGDRIEFIQYNLKKQIAKALKGCEKCNDLSYDEVMEKSEKLVYEFLSKIPSIRDYLATDVVAAFNGDPAAYSTDEIILCYPGFFAITVYRVALDDVEIAKSEAAMVMKLKPERVVSSYSFAVKVDGVENISAVVCCVSGLNGGYFLGKRLCTLAEMPVYVENDCKNGLLQGHFSHFRLPKSADTRVDSPVVLTIRIIKVDKQVQEILVDIKKLITPPTSGEEEEIQPAPDGEIHIEVPVPDGQITVEVDKEESGNSGIGGDIGDWDDETNVDIIV